MLSVKAKEAIKVGLAFVLVYFIALSVAWMNPYWAAFAVAMIALPTAGQSIHKGIDRLVGTVPGCIAGVVILAAAPQSRWLFLLVAGAWIFFTTYMMLRSKNHPYLWNVAGFVCLIITLTGPGSSESLFEHAVFRTGETTMGIVVYTLVTVFLWPRTNAGAIKKASGDLIATQARLFRAAADTMAGRSTKEKLPELHAQEVKQLASLGQALQAEGSESYEVHELRHQWERLQALSTATMETLDRWRSGFPELVRIDVNAALPDLQSFFDELEARFEEIQRALAGNPRGRESRPVSLKLEETALDGLPHLDRAALSLTRKELEKLEALTAAMLRCAPDLAGEPVNTGAPSPIPAAGTQRPESRLPVFDLDHLRGALFATTGLVVGFLVWIFLDPPGHGGWYQFVATAAMGIAGMQQVRTTILVKPFAVALALGLAVYVFIMPQLSTFVGLGSLLFLCMFVNRYFFSGLAQLAGNIGIINMVSVQNQQTYNFAAMANSYLFTVLALVFLFALTYLLRSPRPEKAVLRLLRRFFRSAEFLIAGTTLETEGRLAFMERRKIDFYRYELKTLPAKIAAWGRFINKKRFPNNTPEKVQALVDGLQILVYRIEELLEAGDTHQAQSLARAMGDDLRAWRAGIETTFGKWSSSYAGEPAAGLQERLATWLSGLEERIGAALQQTDTQALGERDAESFFRLLGGMRGVSDAAVAYAAVAGTIDWEEWREEVFQ